MIPVPHSAIAVAQQKVPIHVRTDNVDLLTAPPRSLQWPPVRLSDKANDYYLAPNMNERPRRWQPAQGAINGLLVGVQGG
jgi:hypothetical protein